MGSKLRTIQNSPESRVFFCPGCECGHRVVISGETHPVWGWNGSSELPTFTPSILVRGTLRLTDEEITRVLHGEIIEPTPTICHSFVTDGKIRFLADSTHALKGQTVDLPDTEEW